MDKKVQVAINKLCDDIDTALADSDFELASLLIEQRLTKLKALEESVDKSDQSEFQVFREYLLSIQQADDKNLTVVTKARVELTGLAAKQQRSSKAVAAYSQVKFQK